MVGLDLIYENLVCAFFCKLLRKSLVLNQTGLLHDIPVTESLNIMSEPDESFNPSPSFYPNGLG
jgi:hypothetical protein